MSNRISHEQSTGLSLIYLQDVEEEITLYGYYGSSSRNIDQGSHFAFV